MATRLILAKMAVAELQTATVESLTIGADSSQHERAASELLDQTFEEVLQSAFWTSARRRISLAADGKNAPAFGKTYQFNLPEQFLRLIRIDDSDYNYAREGRTIVSNDPGPLNVRYVARISVEEADPLLVSATAKRLAWRMAVRIGASDAARVRLLGEYQTLRREALTAEANERGATIREGSNILDDAGIDYSGRALTPREKSQ